MPYKDPEKRKARQRVYRQKNSAHIQQYMAQYRADNSARIKTSIKEWLKANPEKKIASRKAWRAKNPTGEIQGQIKYKAENGPKILEGQLKQYGLTLDEYKKMESAQNGKCRICQQKCKMFSRLSVDHNHETGKVRGLLCQRCNLGLGIFNDSIEYLERCVAYIKENSI